MLFEFGVHYLAFAVVQCANRHFTGAEVAQEKPWAHYATPEQAFDAIVYAGDTSLAATLAADFGFEFERRNGKGSKQAFNTTTVSGRSDADDPHSLIVLYRSHLGGFGNLLEILLSKRSKAAKALAIQSDLATVNLVTDPSLLERFDITYVGCMSHARRPFAQYEEQDPDLCDAILHQFKGLAIQEHSLSRFGRNEQNVSAVRDVDSRAIWVEIKRYSEKLTKRWSSSSHLGTGARYIIRHYDKLTAYLDNPRLELTNNFSERMLRMEKQIQASSMFRQTLEGRFALDVMRSVLQTAVAAGVPIEEYLLHVLKSDPREVLANPHEFTSNAWAAKLYAENPRPQPPELPD